MGNSDRSDRDKGPQLDRRTGGDRRTRAGASAQDGRADASRRAAAERRAGRGRREDDRAWQALPFEAPVPLGFSPEQGLLVAAAAAREFAQAHYSKFKVGAALETADGTIVTGCNIENATYGLTLCAERVALVKALSEGHTRFMRLAVVAETEVPTPPCGACRQLLWEYCGNIEVFLGTRQALSGHYRLASLLPLPFDRRLLE